MQVTETAANGLQREYKIIVDAADIEQRVEQQLDDLGGKIRLPGFRPGKIPKKLLRQRYGKSVLGEVLEGAVNDSSRETLTERGIRPAQQPKIEITKFDDGADLEYTMAVEILPEIEPIDFGALELTRMRAEVTDDTVADGLTKLAEGRKSFAKVDKPRAAKIGDQVLIDFSGSVGGDKRPEMQGSDMEVELGSGMLIPGFEDQIAGKKDGEFTISVTFPEGYHDEGLAGQDASFDVVLKEVRAAQTMEVGEDLAKDVGFDDLKGLKDAVRRQTENEFEQISRARIKRELLDKLAEAYTFEVPGGMVDAEFDSIWQQVEDARRQAGDDDPDAGKSDEELKEEYRGIAERRVRLGLILSEVAQINNLQISQDELNRAIIAEARRHPGQEQQVFEFFQKNPQAVDGLRAPILEDKVVDYILEIAKVEEKAATPEDLMRDPDDEDTGAKPAKAKSRAKSAAGKKKAAAKPAAKSKASAKSDAEASGGDATKKSAKTDG